MACDPAWVCLPLQKVEDTWLKHICGQTGLPVRRWESGQGDTREVGFPGLSVSTVLIHELRLCEFSDTCYDDFEKLRDNLDSRLMLFVLFK